MATVNELVYMVLDEIKATSDDSFFEEEHVIFLLNHYRPFLLKQRYSDIRKDIPDSNFQTIKLTLVQVPAISGEMCEGGVFLKSEQKIPNIMNINNLGGYTKVLSIDKFSGIFNFIGRDRFRFVGHNKWLENQIYCTIGPDSYLYFKSFDETFLDTLTQVIMTSIFENITPEVTMLSPQETITDVREMTFPIETGLIPNLIELVVKELLGATYRPNDEINNASDDTPDLVKQSK